MSQTATSAQDAALLEALEQNEFDIAGLADFCADSRCVDDCLRQLYQIIRRNREPIADDKKLLAQVLVGMVYVARNDYAADGHQEYWPFLFRRIREAAFADPDKFWGDAVAGPQHQSLLGRWFLVALDAFDYSVPDEGQKYVGPIVFHAGMPYASLPRVLTVIAAACDQFGSQVITLPADIRSGLVTNHFLHRNVERLLASNLQGAAQLWSCLARVVLAWKTVGECSNELEQLPLALDPDEVRAALPTESESPRVSRSALPQLRYDPETGEIRLTFINCDTSANWRVTSSNGPLDLSWCHTHVGLTAEFAGPLPQDIAVEPSNSRTGVGRTFSAYPSDWPGFWFHAHNGNLEDGRTIDASGLASGRWYVIFEGTPTKCSVPFIAQVPLKWSWFTKHTRWTAWEVDVPPRTADCPDLVWHVDDNSFSIPLARRPGPRVEFVSKTPERAFQPDGSQFDVFESAPTVILKRDSATSVQLLRVTTESVAVIGRLDLQPEKPTPLPVSDPGVYQLRESRGVGRTLLRFAIVPGFQIEGPRYDAGRSLVSIAISADEQAGSVYCEDGVDVSLNGHTWTIQSSTIEPFVKAHWRWGIGDIPTLEFRWPIEALRWRVTQTGGAEVRWTRESIFVSPKAVATYDTQLEIQFPITSDLTINGEIYEGKLQSGPSGSMVMLSLLPFGNAIELLHDGRQYTAVFKSEQPLLDSLDATADAGSVTVSWQTSMCLSGAAIVAWDPSDLLSSPKTFNLKEADLLLGEWHGVCAQLPGSEWTAISLARSSGGFFQRLLQMAVFPSEEMEPASLLLHRRTGTVTKYVKKATSWAEFLHHVSLKRLHRKEAVFEKVRKRLLVLSSAGKIEICDLLKVTRSLQLLLNENASSDRDRQWADVILQAMLRVLHRLAKQNPLRAISQGPSGLNDLAAFLNLGLPLGQAFPFRWISDREPLPEDEAYPFRYIRDLWLIGKCRSVLESQLKEKGGSLPTDYDDLREGAVRGVLEFHKQYDLPSIFSFLPLASRTATVIKSDHGHRHSFALPSQSVPCEMELRDALGLSDLALDCQATCDDQFFERRGRSGGSRKGVSSLNSTYSLYWCSDERRWVIENMDSSPPTCCYTNHQPLVVDPLQSEALANNVLRDVFNKWADSEVIPAGGIHDFEFLGYFRHRLISDEVSGRLHTELLQPTTVENKELYGRIVQVVAKPGLSELATIAWQLAWIERITAWEGLDHVFEDATDRFLVQRDFLQGLARALKLWPELMRRSLALAELVYWSLYRGGLGEGLRFRGPSTDEELCLSRSAENGPTELVDHHFATVKQPVKHVGNVSGVIIGYRDGLGAVLLRHRSSPSTAATVQDYLKDEVNGRVWIATFRWRAINIDGRLWLQEKLKQSKYFTLESVMCGLHVTCELSKNPKWEATSIEIQMGKSQVNIPVNRRGRRHSNESD